MKCRWSCVVSQSICQCRMSGIQCCDGGVRNDWVGGRRIDLWRSLKGHVIGGRIICAVMN